MRGSQLGELQMANERSTTTTTEDYVSSHKAKSARSMRTSVYEFAFYTAFECAYG